VNSLFEATLWLDAGVLFKYFRDGNKEEMLTLTIISGQLRLLSQQILIPLF